MNNEIVNSLPLPCLALPSFLFISCPPPYASHANGRIFPLVMWYVRSDAPFQEEYTSFAIFTMQLLAWYEKSIMVGKYK